MTPYHLALPSLNPEPCGVMMTLQASGECTGNAPCTQNRQDTIAATSGDTRAQLKLLRPQGRGFPWNIRFASRNCRISIRRRPS